MPTSRTVPNVADDDDEIQFISSKLRSRGQNRRKDEGSSLELENAHLKQMVFRLQQKHRATRVELKETKEVVLKQSKELEVLHGIDDEALNQKTQRIREAVTCSVCFGVMWDCYSLVECCHTFCSTCVQEIVGEFNSRTNKEAVITKLSNAVRDIRFGPTMAFDRDIISLLHPSNILEAPYRCPVCRKGAYTKPERNFAMKAVMDCLADDPSSHVASSEDADAGKNTLPDGQVLALLFHRIRTEINRSENI